ncbi:hypothetical protein ScPMuIL_008300 [Solemya velum]
MGRFLIFISYIGSHYSGMQVQNVAGRPRPSVKTVSGVLEKCLKMLSPQNEVKIVTSSRTDAEVHALRSSVHVDLVHRNFPDKEFDPRLLTVFLNRRLMKLEEPIRVLEIRRVNDDFHCRYQARNRSYMYRLAVVREELPDGQHFWDLPMTPFEYHRSYFRFPPFDMNLFLATAEVLSGTHFYNAFTTPTALRGRTREPIRTVQVSVKRGSAFLQEYQPYMSENLEFWEIHVQSWTFLYRMVRRMVGAMLDVARGKQDIEHIKAALSDPRYVIPPPGISSVPGYALFLKDVEYCPEDLQYTPGEKSSEDLLDTETEKQAAKKEVSSTGSREEPTDNGCGEK